MAVSGAGPPGPPFLFSVVCPVPPNFRERTRDILLLQELHASGTSLRVPGFSFDTSRPTRKETKMKTLIKYTAAVALTGAMRLRQRHQAKRGMGATRPRSVSAWAQLRAQRSPAPPIMAATTICGYYGYMTSLPMPTRRATRTTLTLTTATLTRRHRGIGIIQDGRTSTAPTTSRSTLSASSRL